jgi:DNA-binding NarL/FixJ family response regulator
MLSSSPISVLLVDDHEVARESLAAMLGPDRRLALAGHRAPGGAEALSHFERLRPKVVVLDLRMPEGEGFAVLSELRHRFPKANVLVLAAIGHAQEIATARKLGARGCLPKSCTPEELTGAICRIAAGGECWESPGTNAAGEVLKLTRREVEVLDGIRLGHTNRDIAKSIGVSEDTVKSHVKTLFGKLEAANRGEAVARAFELGLLSWKGVIAWAG